MPLNSLARTAELILKTESFRARTGGSGCVQPLSRFLTQERMPYESLKARCEQSDGRGKASGQELE